MCEGEWCVRIELVLDDFLDCVPVSLFQGRVTEVRDGRHLWKYGEEGREIGREEGRGGREVEREGGREGGKKMVR